MSSKKRRAKAIKAVKKDLAGEEFFQLDKGQSSASFELHMIAALACIIFAWWVWMLNPIPNVQGDQQNIVTMVLSHQHPENFARDPVWGNKIADYYPSVPRLIISPLIEKFGIVGGHRVLQLPLSIAYLFVMYGILYCLTRSIPAALLVALASMMWRWSMAETYWGISRMQAVQPRSIALVLIPMLFILFWKLRDSWKLLIPFFVAGLLFNINPPSALNFAALSLSSLFLISFFDRQSALSLRDRIIRLIGAGAAFIAGAGPFLYTNITSQNRGSIQLSGQALQEHKEALQYYLSKIAGEPTPMASATKALLFGFAVPIVLAAIAWYLRKEKRNMFDKWLVCFFLFAFIGMVAIQYALWPVWSHFKLDPYIASRGQKFAYLVLYIYIAYLLAQIFRRLALKNRAVLIVAAALIVAIMPVFGNKSHDPLGQWRFSSGQIKTLLQGKKMQMGSWHQRIADIAAWARQKTPKDALFLFAHPHMCHFRIYALRSIVTSEAAGGIAYYAGPKQLAIWAKYQQQLEQITANSDVPVLLNLAEQSRADFIVAPSDFPKVPAWPVVMRDRFWTVYQKP